MKAWGAAEKEARIGEPGTQLGASLVRGSIIAGTYRLLAPLGTGGMGEVFEAEHLRLGICVAVKLLRRDANRELSAEADLLREARLAASVEGQHVVRTLDCGTSDGQPFVVMERLRGEDLEALLRRETQLSVQRSIAIARQVCLGLSELHSAGIVHRDLKPANIFLARTTTGDCCKLLDFGIARSLEDDTAEPPSAATGTLRYMAPEQLGNGEVGPWTDIYAAGAILYRCLTGRAPHDGETTDEIVLDLRHHDPRRVEHFRPEVSEQLSKLVAGALSRRRVERPESALAFARDLSALMTDGAAPATPGRRADDATMPVRGGRAPLARRTWSTITWSLLVLAPLTGSLSYVACAARQSSEASRDVGTRPLPQAARVVRAPSSPGASELEIEESAPRPLASVHGAPTASVSVGATEPSQISGSKRGRRSLPPGSAGEAPVAGKPTTSSDQLTLEKNPYVSPPR